MLLISCLILSINITAQGKRTVPVSLQQNSIDNFILGIQSDNAGIKKSCIYFSGKFYIKESRSALIDEFLLTEDGEMQALILWSLFRICDKECISDISEINKNLKSEKLKILVDFFKSLKTYEIAISQNGN